MQMRQNRKNFLYAGIFLIYAILTLFGALRHELWFDEAQAWVIVRDNDFLGIMNALRYEGHPPLWYMILLPFARLGFSCEVLPLISWFFSVMTVLLILWKAPFGLGMKAAVIFSGGFLFFHSVNSRVYCLIPFLLCLIAILYPKRKKHPVLFGLLIGLLANTHVCFCGMVGIFGIYMLVELFRDWKNASAKENLFRVIGLGIAGVGVLMLVLPLLHSISLNDSTADISAGMTFGKGLYYFLTGLDDAMYLCVTGDAYPTEFLHPIASAAAVGIGFFLIIFRRWKKWLIAVLVFLFFYLFIVSVVWWNNSCRAAMMIFALIFFFWLALEEGGETESKDSPAWLGQLPKRLSAVIRIIREAPRKSLTVIFTLILLTTVPLGAVYLCADWFGLFSVSKPTAEYIRENFESGTVFVSADDTLAPFSAYLPEYLFYSTDRGSFYTYALHAKAEAVSEEQIESDLAPYENLYQIIRWGYNSDYGQGNPPPIFTVNVDIVFPHNTYACAIVPYREERGVS